MKKLSCKTLSTYLLSMALLSFHHWAMADILQIGDNTYSNVFNQLKKAGELDFEYGILVNSASKYAGISNHEDWLYKTRQTLELHHIDALVISLGKKDLRLAKQNFPGIDKLEADIHQILATVNTQSPVFWILPHALMSKSRKQTAQRHIVNDALMRVYSSGKWPNLHLISLDDWAASNDLQLSELLNRKQVRFSREGAADAADIIVSQLHLKADETPE